MKRFLWALSFASLVVSAADTMSFQDIVFKIQPRKDGTRMVLFKTHAAAYFLPKDAPKEQLSALEDSQKKGTRLEISHDEDGSFIRSVSLPK